MKTILLLLTLLTSFNGLTQWREIEYDVSRFVDWGKGLQAKDNNGNLLHDVIMVNASLDDGHIDSTYIKYGFPIRDVRYLESYGKKNGFFKRYEYFYYSNGKTKLYLEFCEKDSLGRRCGMETHYDKNEKKIKYLNYWEYDKKILRYENFYGTNNNSSGKQYYANGNIASTEKVVNGSISEKCYDMNGNIMDCDNQCFGAYGSKLVDCPCYDNDGNRIECD